MHEAIDVWSRIQDGKIHYAENYCRASNKSGPGSTEIHTQWQNQEFLLPTEFRRGTCIWYRRLRKSEIYCLRDMSRGSRRGWNGPTYMFFSYLVVCISMHTT